MVKSVLTPWTYVKFSKSSGIHPTLSLSKGREFGFSQRLPVYLIVR